LKKNILLITDGIIHPSLFARYWLRKSLSQFPEYTYQHINSINKLVSKDPEFYNSLVLYYHHKNIEIDALEILKKYVINGGGILAIHSATASFKQNQKYFEILGGKFLHHDKPKKFAVTQSSSQEKIFGEIEEFIVYEELYQHQLFGENRIHFYTKIDNIEIPLVWTRKYGNGRICYITFGHIAGSMRQSQIINIIKNGLAWTSSNE
jgi:type 1 glutamine amidotransferase